MIGPLLRSPWLPIAIFCAALLENGGDASAQLTVPEGFEFSLYADDELAHDIYSMTVDSAGRVVVSGAGYVRILLDEDADGVAESFQTFTDGPITGAQGMFFDGHDLVCTGDGGVLRYRDRNADGRADGPAEVLFPLKTGGEHFAHSIHKGPDGWWYLLVGNFAQITDKDVTRAQSPVRVPEAGVLMRFTPDFSASEVVADGFRNPYDFDFHPLGDLFTFDSDEEREVSLPWYRPTRVFQILPGYHAGWVTTSWIRPEGYPDMPPVAVHCGRSSPTGVICYRHHRFPERYHGALFVLDWTFGRVLTVSLTPRGSTMSGTIETFLAAEGQFGLAPTDIAVTPEGDLLLCVGGRGTRGSVYRIRYRGEMSSGAEAQAARGTDPLTRCLTAPQPLASWSRAQWEPVARHAGRAALVAAVRDRQRPWSQRVRAIEVLVELFGGLDTDTIAELSEDPFPPVRARAAWSLGFQASDAQSWVNEVPYLDDDDAQVVRVALESLLWRAGDRNMIQLLPRLRRLLAAPDCRVRQAAAKVVARCDVQLRADLIDSMRQDSLPAQTALLLGLTERSRQVQTTAFEFALQTLATTSDPALLLEAVRLAQQALGDVGKSGSFPSALNGYANTHDLSDYGASAVTILEGRFPTGQSTIDHELARLIAMIPADSAGLVEKIVRQLNAETSPVDDIHYLIVLSRLISPRTAQQRQHVARALVQLDSKLESGKLPQDLNWDLRVGEMYSELVRRDPLLPEAVIDQADFGRPGHILFTRDLSEDLKTRATDRVVAYLEAHSQTAWTGEIITLLATSAELRHRALVRQRFDDPSLQGAVILALANAPDVRDRKRYIQGLTSPDFAVVRASVTALERLPASEDADSQFALLYALRRLGADRQESTLRERVERLLLHNLGPADESAVAAAQSDPQLAAVIRWTASLRQRFPDEAQQYLRSEKEEQARVQAILTQVDWDAGEVDRGRALFQKHSCSSCHNTRTAVGPDLTGVAKRFSRDDLFTALLFPNRDVSPRYHTTLVETSRGKILSGLVIYESVDGLMLRDSTNQTIRIESSDIDSRRQLPTSLMPSGLLDSLQPSEVADLYAFLQTL
ncbi:MAG: DUF7133 domain-containing protein [Pirellulaceae bacterium]